MSIAKACRSENRRDGDEFVVLFYPDDTVVLRHAEPQALRKMCVFCGGR